MNNWKKIALLGLVCLIPYIGIPLYLTIVLLFLAKHHRFVKNCIIKGHKEIEVDLAQVPELKPKFEGQEFSNPENLV